MRHTHSHTPVVDFSRRLRADPSGQAFFGIAGYTGISNKKEKKVSHKYHLHSPSIDMSKM